MAGRVELTREEQADLFFDLINAFALARDPLSSAQLLQDLLTPAELRYLSKRLRIAKMLVGGIKQENIIAELHCSYGTVAKVRVWLDESGEGLKKIIRQLPKRKTEFKMEKGYYGYGLPQILIGSYFAYLSENERKRLESFVKTLNTKELVLKEIGKVLDEHFRRRK